MVRPWLSKCKNKPGFLFGVAYLVVLLLCRDIRNNTHLEEVPFAGSEEDVENESQASDTTVRATLSPSTERSRQALKMIRHERQEASQSTVNRRRAAELRKSYGNRVLASSLVKRGRPTVAAGSSVSDVQPGRLFHTPQRPRNSSQSSSQTAATAFSKQSASKTVAPQVKGKKPLLRSQRTSVADIQRKRRSPAISQVAARVTPLPRRRTTNGEAARMLSSLVGVSPGMTPQTQASPTSARKKVQHQKPRDENASNSTDPVGVNIAQELRMLQAKEQLRSEKKRAQARIFMKRKQEEKAKLRQRRNYLQNEQLAKKEAALKKLDAFAKARMTRGLALRKKQQKKLLRQRKMEEEQKCKASAPNQESALEIDPALTVQHTNVPASVKSDVALGTSCHETQEVSEHAPPLNRESTEFNKIQKLRQQMKETRQETAKQTVAAEKAAKKAAADKAAREKAATEKAAAEKAATERVTAEKAAVNKVHAEKAAAEKLAAEKAAEAKVAAEKAAAEKAAAEKAAAEKAANEKAAAEKAATEKAAAEKAAAEKAAAEKAATEKAAAEKVAAEKAAEKAAGEKVAAEKAAAEKAAAEKAAAEKAAAEKAAAEKVAADKAAAEQAAAAKAAAEKAAAEQAAAAKAVAEKAAAEKAAAEKAAAEKAAAEKAAAEKAAAEKAAAEKAAAEKAAAEKVAADKAAAEQAAAAKAAAEKAAAEQAAAAKAVAEKAAAEKAAAEKAAAEKAAAEKAAAEKAAAEKAAAEKAAAEKAAAEKAAAEKAAAEKAAAEKAAAEKAAAEKAAAEKAAAEKAAAEKAAAEKAAAEKSAAEQAAAENAAAERTSVSALAIDRAEFNSLATVQVVHENNADTSSKIGKAPKIFTSIPTAKAFSQFAVLQQANEKMFSQARSAVSQEPSNAALFDAFALREIVVTADAQFNAPLIPRPRSSIDDASKVGDEPDSSYGDDYFSDVDSSVSGDNFVAPPEPKDFISASSYDGKRKNYVFLLDNQGLGYVHVWL